MENNSLWSVLISSIIYEDSILRGQDLDEWLGLVRSDYDEIDRDLIHNETNGGG